MLNILPLLPYAICILLSLKFFTGDAIAQTDSVGRNGPMYLKEVIPSPAYRLFQWPDDSVLNGPARIGTDSVEIKAPQLQASDWIENVLSESWQPPVDTGPLFVRAELNERDTIRLKYETHGYETQVCQTATIFTVRLCRVDGGDLGGDLSGKIEKAKELCSQLFNPTGRRWTGQGEAVPVLDLNKKIVSYSFDHDSIQSLPGDSAVWGRPQTMAEAGVEPTRNDAEADQSNDPENQDWDKEPAAWSYWFRNVYWWNDGRSAGFYFLKIEVGPWVPSYESRHSPDRHWFKSSGH